MTLEPLDEAYFRWLYRQVAPLRQKNPARTYWLLLRQLHDTEFTWFVPNDDNRVSDGAYLRYEFLLEINSPSTRTEDHPSLARPGCSMLEMLVALAGRLSFNGGGDAAEWFWHILANLGLRQYNDANPGDPEEIDRVLARVIERTYEPNGNGGLFPLRETNVDQRRVEIWYQMNDYLIERG